MTKLLRFIFIIVISTKLQAYHDLGTYGNLYDISEPDLLQLIKNK